MTITRTEAEQILAPLFQAIKSKAEVGVSADEGEDERQLAEFRSLYELQYMQSHMASLLMMLDNYQLEFEQHRITQIIAGI
jgi:hypothetical protein